MCILCDSLKGKHPAADAPAKDYKTHGDGINDPKLVVDYDPLFASVLGTGVNRRQLLKWAGLGALSGLMPGQSAFAEDKKWDPTIRIGYLPITDASALLVAHELGFFKKEGIESAPPTLIRGWPPLIEGFSTKRFNLTHMLIPAPIWMRYGNKFPIKITAWNHTNGSGMVVGKDSGINSPKDFGGKQFAIPFWYSIHNILSQKVMRDAGITPVIRPQDAKLAPNECNFIVLNPPDMPAALASRAIDGYCVAEPFNALGEVKAGAKILRMTGDIWKGHPCCVVVMHEQDTVDPARAAWAQGVHNAIVAAQIYIVENRQAAAELLSKDGKGYLPFPKQVITRAMMLYDVPYPGNPNAIKHKDWGMDRINFQGWPYRSTTEIVVNDLKKTSLIGDTSFLDKLDPKFVASDLVNYTFIKNALEANPKWKGDRSVPNSGDPYTRSEIIAL